LAVLVASGWEQHPLKRGSRRDVCGGARTRTRPREASREAGRL